MEKCKPPDWATGAQFLSLAKGHSYETIYNSEKLTNAPEMPLSPIKNQKLFKFK